MVGRGRGISGSEVTSPGTGNVETRTGNPLFTAQRTLTYPGRSITGLSPTPVDGRSYQGLFFRGLTTNVPTGNGYFVQGFGPAVALEAFENGELTIFPSADELDFEDPKSHPIPMPLIVPLIQAIELDQIKSPNNFFIKPSGRVKGPFSVMQSNLNYWYNKNKATVPGLRLEDLVPGGHYVAFSKLDGGWHRVMLKSCEPDGSVLLQLLDDGGSIHTSAKYIRPIRKSFCELPMQAFHASLQMVEGDAWSPEDAALFREDILGREFFSIIIKNRMDPEFAPFQTVEIVLLELKPKGHATYTFGSRLNLTVNF